MAARISRVTVSEGTRNLLKISAKQRTKTRIRQRLVNKLENLTVQEDALYSIIKTFVDKARGWAQQVLGIEDTDEFLRQYGELEQGLDATFSVCELLAATAEDMIENQTRGDEDALSDTEVDISLVTVATGNHTTVFPGTMSTESILEAVTQEKSPPDDVVVVVKKEPQDTTQETRAGTSCFQQPPPETLVGPAQQPKPHGTPQKTPQKTTTGPALSPLSKPKPLQIIAPRQQPLETSAGTSQQSKPKPLQTVTLRQLPQETITGPKPLSKPKPLQTSAPRQPPQETSAGPASSPLSKPKPLQTGTLQQPPQEISLGPAPPPLSKPQLPQTGAPRSPPQVTSLGPAPPPLSKPQLLPTGAPPFQFQQFNLPPDAVVQGKETTSFQPSYVVFKGKAYPIVHTPTSAQNPRSAQTGPQLMGVRNSVPYTTQWYRKRKREQERAGMKKRNYKKRKEFIACTKCGKNRHAGGHRQYYMNVYCPETTSVSYEEWRKPLLTKQYGKKKYSKTRL